MDHMQDMKGRGPSIGKPARYERCSSASVMHSEAESSFLSSSQKLIPLRHSFCCTRRESMRNFIHAGLYGGRPKPSQKSLLMGSNDR